MKLYIKPEAGLPLVQAALVHAAIVGFHWNISLTLHVSGQKNAADMARSMTETFARSEFPEWFQHMDFDWSDSSEPSHGKWLS